MIFQRTIGQILHKTISIPREIFPPNCSSQDAFILEELGTNKRTHYWLIAYCFRGLTYINIRLSIRPLTLDMKNTFWVIKLNITIYLSRLLDLEREIILVLSHQTYIFRILLRNMPQSCQFSERHLSYYRFYLLRL